MTRSNVVLYYEIRSFRIIDVPGYNDVADLAERMSFAEHWKLVAESSEFHFTLSKVPLDAEQSAFFQLEIRNKNGTFEVKGGMQNHYGN